MHTVAVTRFNDKTWEENCNWRKKNKHDGCIYGSPSIISSDIPTGASVFIIEMNNAHRRIEGIGLIRNQLQPKKAKIYWDNYYNRYTYKSCYHINRVDFNEEEKYMIAILEELIFYGSKHVQRGRGIQKLPISLLVSECIFKTLGKELLTRLNYKIALQRLSILQNKKEWINSNRNTRIVNWLRGIFNTRFGSE